MNIQRTGFYTGSFDPITNGHVDVLRSALRILDHIIIGIGIHASKKGLFDFRQRKELIEMSLPDAGINNDHVDIIAFDNLAVDAAQNAGANVIIRGLRDGTDFDYEMQMAGMNSQLVRDITTIFVPASVATRPISATLVRQIAAMGGDVNSFVPPPVAKALQELK